MKRMVLNVSKEKIVFDKSGDYHIEQEPPNESPHGERSEPEVVERSDTTPAVTERSEVDTSLNQMLKPTNKKIIKSKTSNDKELTVDNTIATAAKKDVSLATIVSMDEFLKKTGIMQEQLESVIYRNLSDLLCSPATAFNFSHNIIAYGVVIAKEKTYIVHLQDSNKTIHTVVKVTTTGTAAKCDTMEAICAPNGIIEAGGRLLCSVSVSPVVLQSKYSI